LGDANLDQLAELAEAGVVAFKFFWGYAIKADDYSLIYNYRSDMKGVLPPPDEGQIYTMFRRIAQLGKRVGIHAENFNIIKTLTELERRSGAQDYEALLRTRPVSCETSIIDTAIDMAKEIGVPLHILHVGVGDGVEHIRRAKADGVDVTAETCSHYLALTNGDAPRCGAVMKTYPLIRTQADQDRVWQGVWDGTIDWVCSDHAPHTWEEKQRGFWDAPAGISGVEALSPVVLTAVNDGKIDIHRAVEITSAAAAKNFGLYPRKGTIREGADADFAIVDMEQEYTFDQKKMYSKAKWTPYDGMRFRGRVVKTILRGGTTMTDGQVTADCRGRYLPVR
jgi:dihydroorotase (multifunctional complex type)